MKFRKRRLSYHIWEVNHKFFKEIWSKFKDYQIWKSDEIPEKRSKPSNLCRNMVKTAETCVLKKSWGKKERKRKADKIRNF